MAQVGRRDAEKTVQGVESPQSLVEWWEPGADGSEIFICINKEVSRAELGREDVRTRTRANGSVSITASLSDLPR